MNDAINTLLWIFSFSFIFAGFKEITSYGGLYLIAGILCLPVIPYGNRPGTRFNGLIRAFRIIMVFACLGIAGLLKTGKL